MQVKLEIGRTIWQLPNQNWLMQTSAKFWVTRTSNSSMNDNHHIVAQTDAACDLRE